MRRECKYHAHFTGMDTEFELKWQKKERQRIDMVVLKLIQCFGLLYSGHRFFSRPLMRLKHGWMNNNFIWTRLKTSV